MYNYAVSYTLCITVSLQTNLNFLGQDFRE